MSNGSKSVGEGYMAETMTSAQRVHRRATRFFWCWLVLATVLSLSGNVVHALLAAGHEATASRVLAASVAAVPPVILLLSIHGIAVLVRAGASGGVYRTAIAATAVLGTGAFALSFVALMDLAALAGVPAALTPVLPLIVDVAIAVATLALVAVGDRPASRARGASPRPAASAAARSTAASTVVPRAAVSPPAASAAARSTAASADAPQDDAPRHASQDDAPVHRAAASSGASPSAVHHTTAARLVDSGVVSKPATEVAAVLALADDGQSARRIAAATGMDPRTVGKVIKAAVTQEPSADEPGRSAHDDAPRTLTAVG